MCALSIVSRVLIAPTRERIFHGKSFCQKKIEEEIDLGGRTQEMK